MAIELQNSTSNPLSNMEVSTKPLIETPKVESNRINSLLKKLGQSNPTQDLNRSLYTTEFLDSLAKENELNLPDIEAQKFDNLGFSDIQTKLLEQSSQQIASQTNLATNALEDRLQKQIRAIVQGSQDQAISRAQVLGDVGLNVDKSSRNLSFVSDAQARGQQQILDVTQESVNQLNTIIAGANQSQTQLTQQAVELNLQKEVTLRQEAERLTQSLGFLYEVKDGQVKASLDAAGNQIATLPLQQFELNKTSAQLEQEGKKLANQATQYGNQQLFTADDKGNITPTELGRLRAANAIGQENVNALGLEAENEYIKGLSELDNINATNNQQAGNLQSADPVVRNQAIAGLEAQRATNGQAFGIYWNNTTVSEGSLIKTDKDGNKSFDSTKSKTEAVYDDKAIQTYGLFLNRPFNSGSYTNAVKDVAEKDRPDKKFTEQVKLFISQGDSQENFNKILTTSDDGNSILIAHRNESPEAGDGYKFKYINTSLLSETEKNDLVTKIGQVDQGDVQALSNMIKEVTSASKVLSADINSEEFNLVMFKNEAPNSLVDEIQEKLNFAAEQANLSEADYKSFADKLKSGAASFSFKTSADTRMTDDLPKNRELIPIILTAQKKGNIQVLKDKGFIDANYNITKLQTAINTDLNPALNKLGIKGISDLNDGNITKFLENIYTNYQTGNPASSSSSSSGAKPTITAAAKKDYTQVANFISNLTDVYNQINANANNETETKYKRSMFESLLLSAYPTSNLGDIDKLINLIKKNSNF